MPVLPPAQPEALAIGAELFAQQALQLQEVLVQLSEQPERFFAEEGGWEGEMRNAYATAVPRLQAQLEGLVTALSNTAAVLSSYAEQLAFLIAEMEAEEATVAAATMGAGEPAVLAAEQARYEILEGEIASLFAGIVAQLQAAMTAAGTLGPAAIGGTAALAGASSSLLNLATAVPTPGGGSGIPGLNTHPAGSVRLRSAQLDKIAPHIHRVQVYRSQLVNQATQGMRAGQPPAAAVEVFTKGSVLRTLSGPPGVPIISQCPYDTFILANGNASCAEYQAVSELLQDSSRWPNGPFKFFLDHDRNIGPCPSCQNALTYLAQQSGKPAVIYWRELDSNGEFVYYKWTANP